MKRVDVLLVLGYFRSATAFLSVIRHLSPRLRVGIMPALVDPSYLAKTPKAQQQFLEICVRFGAEIIEQGTPVETRLLIVQQFPYPEETAQTINATVQAERRVGAMGLAASGLPLHDAFLAQFNIRKVLTPSRRLFEFLIGRRDAVNVYRDIAVEEVGLPFKKHPVFPEFSADYLIAAPTAFSFRKERHKHQFFRDVLRLLDQIPKSALVVYKSHNASARDYFTPRAYAAIGAALGWLPGARQSLTYMASRTPGWLGRQVERTLTALLHAQVLRRAVSMSSITPYADISLEAFLPSVKHGVIGGLSNTIWGTLYFGLTYYNCADEEERKKSSVNELLPHKDSTNYLDLNLQFFSVPYCGGDLSRGARGEDIVTPADREGDLLQAVREELEATSTVAKAGSR